MKNIILQFLYRIKGNKDYPPYEKMLSLSKESFKRNVLDVDEIIVVSGDVSDFNEVFFRVFEDTFRHHGPDTNIFVAAPDIICKKPIRLFNRFEEMRLFMHTPAAKPKDLPAYFNDGPRYFPATMDVDLWRLGFHLWEKGCPDKGLRAFGQKWGISQYIHNRMFFSQASIKGQQISDLEIPKLGYQFPCGESGNNLAFTEASVVHFHATRGPQQTLARMRKHLDGALPCDYTLGLDRGKLWPGNHRAEIGGQWDRIRQHQFEYLKSRGLRPEHVLLDLGCGSLRGGTMFIPYLDAGNYLGLGIEEQLMQSGVYKELGLGMFYGKRPELAVSENFNTQLFTKKPDMVLGQSLLTHFTHQDCVRCLSALREGCTDRTQVYMTYFPSARPRKNPAQSHPHADFFYTPQEMAQIGEEAGFSFENLGEFGHYRNHHMALYRSNV